MLIHISFKVWHTCYEVKPYSFYHFHLFLYFIYHGAYHESYGWSFRSFIHSNFTLLFDRNFNDQFSLYSPDLINHPFTIPMTKLFNAKLFALFFLRLIHLPLLAPRLPDNSSLFENFKTTWLSLGYYVDYGDDSKVNHLAFAHSEAFINDPSVFNYVCQRQLPVKF